ncbi:MAG TPA: hypothetical protein VFC92_11165 [Bacteroidales bacterium]|nr:hypothetical protein [Bacteroidales bacterium]
MKSIRTFILSFGKFNLLESKSIFYFLLFAFIILLIATESVIKNTFLPL